MADDVQVWTSQLSSGNVEQQIAAAEALARLGTEARPAAVALVESCGSSDETLREWSVAALEGLGPPSAGQIAPLLQLARDPSLDVAYWAITLLGRAGDAAASAVALLADVVRNSPESSLRERAAWALGKMGSVAQPAAPALREAAASDQPRLSRLAKNALEAVVA